jgi:hypothetical protein
VRIAIAERTDARVQLELRVRDDVVDGRVVDSPAHRIEAGDERGSDTFATRGGKRALRKIEAALDPERFSTTVHPRALVFADQRFQCV